MHRLQAFRRLQSRLFQLVRWTHCSFGSALLKPMQWLSHKPWYSNIASKCTCGHWGDHFVTQGTFARDEARRFSGRCTGGAEAVYGAFPRIGQAVSEFSGRYPVPAMRVLAAGAVAALKTEPDVGRRARAVAPSWIREFVETVPFEPVVAWDFHHPSHSNALESRVVKTVYKLCARKHPNSRIVGLVDSMVTLGSHAEGRSSSSNSAPLCGPPQLGSLTSCAGRLLASILWPIRISCPRPGTGGRGCLT